MRTITRILNPSRACDRQIASGIAAFLTEHGDGRIRSDTLERYRYLNSLALVVYRSRISLSATIIIEGEAHASVSATVHSHRRHGHATACVRTKGKALRPFVALPASTIALDNIASLGLMRRAGWTSVTSVTLRRSSGPYVAKLFIYQ